MRYKVKAEVLIRDKPTRRGSNNLGRLYVGEIIETTEPLIPEISGGVERGVWVKHSRGYSAMIHDSSPTIIFLDKG